MDTITVTETATVERPSQERYQVLISDLTLAKQQLASFELLTVLESTPAPGTGYENLLEFRYPRSGKQDVPRKVKLESKLVGTRAVVAVLEAELEAFNAAEQAWLDSRPIEASAKDEVTA
jgi:hypothetical protein